MEKTRNYSFDLLRIIAAFTVVVLHVSSRYLMLGTVNDADFCAANFYDSVNRIGVPIFVMLSGALFLEKEKEIDLKRLWIHNILRLFVVFIVWSYAYYIYQSVYEWHFDFWHQGIMRTVTGIVYASDHLWYIGMIVGLYAISPIIRTWLKKASKQDIDYFLLLFVAVEVLIPTLSILLSSSLAEKLLNTFKIAELSGYAGYFVLGYYLCNYRLPKEIKLALYSSLPFCVTFNYFISYKMSENLNAYHPGIYDCFGIFTFIESMAFFLFIIENVKSDNVPPYLQNFVSNVSKDTFGVYLMHVMIINYLFSEGFFEITKPVVIWEIPMAVIIFICSVLVSALLRRIPYAGRYIC